MEVIGTVVTGQGLAVPWQKKNLRAVERLRKLMGWDRIELGSLNVKSAAFTRMAKDVPEPIRCTLNGHCAAIVKYIGGCAEIMGPHHFRTMLGLVDGDEVIVASDDPKAEEWSPV